jgi:hypothetical protein
MQTLKNITEFSTETNYDKNYKLDLVQEFGLPKNDPSFIFYCLFHRYALFFWYGSLTSHGKILLFVWIYYYEGNLIYHVTKKLFNNQNAVHS